jgi:hypothetical protein
VAPGIYGADIEQLRALSQSMGRSGSRLLDTERQISSLVSSTAWSGHDGGTFRREWSGTLRPLLNKASQQLTETSRMLLTQADEQENASNAGGGGSIPGGATNASSTEVPGDAPTTGLESILSVAGSPEWWAANAAVTGAGLYTDNLLATMAKGDLLTKLTNWPWLTAQYAQTPGVGYVRGTQVLNGASMLGRLSGGLGVVTGVFQFGQGATTGNTGMMVDGGISTVLAAGSFIPGAGPFFAVAGIAWGGMGLLATNLGYGSASEMVGDAASKTVDAVADGAKKVWGWLT